MMCEKMRNLAQMQQPIKASLQLMHVKRIWTHIIGSKQQTSKGLKKTVDHAQ
jgi:hypothetical protein